MIKFYQNTQKEKKIKNFIYYDNDKIIISREGIEWLCKNYFKRKYLQLLEIYKMKLTEKFIEAGYIYDVFL